MLSALLCLALSAPIAALTPSTEGTARPYDAVHYRIDVRLKGEGLFENKLTLTLKPSRALSAIELDAYGLQVSGAQVNGQKAEFSTREDKGLRSGVLTLKTPKPLPAGKEVNVEVRYSVQAGVANEGIFFTAPAVEGGLPSYFTQFQTNFAQRFFPCNDRPGDKASTEIFAVVDSRYQVLSNGTKVKDEVYSEGGENLRRVHWTEEKPHPTYAVALAIGEFEAVEVQAPVPASLYVAKGQADRTFIAADITASALKFQSTYLGVKYPWAKYDQVAVPHFIWGGMENTSLVMMRENGLVLDHKNYIFGRGRITSLVSHELAHQWFGDDVTCKTWNDTWLNEGFATFLEDETQAAYYENDSIDVARSFEVLHRYFDIEDGPRSHPLVGKTGPTAESAFDAISYEKGAYVLRMLELWLGKAEFKKGLKAYLEKYAYANASSEDFFAAVAQATHKEKELRPFKDSWLHQQGYPVITPELHWSGSTLTVTIRQRPNLAGEKGAFVFKLPIVLHRDNAPAFHQQQTVTVDKPEVTVKFELPAMPQWVNWNRNGTVLARINTASIGEQEWLLAARSDPDPVWRMMSQVTLFGELGNPQATEQASPSPAAMDAVLEVLAADPSPYVREALLTRISEAKWKKMPAELGPVLLALARRPDKLSDDAYGMVRVRRAAMEALGKTDLPEGRQFLLRELVLPQQDLNYLGALATGVGKLGSAEAIATLGQALNTHRPRGHAYFEAVARALGSVENVEVLPRLAVVFAEAAGNSELERELLRTLQHNATLKQSPELTSFIESQAVGNPSLSDNIKLRLITLLDQTQTPETQAALKRISQKAESEAVKASALKVLEHNFPPPTVTPVKGKALGKKKP